MKHLTTTLAVSLCLSTVVIKAIYAIKAFPLSSNNDSV
jgi:hypothetical protein